MITFLVNNVTLKVGDVTCDCSLSQL